MKYIIGAVIGVIIAYLIGLGIWCGLWFLVCKCFSFDFVLLHATGVYIIVCVVMSLLKQIFGGNK